MKKFLFFYLLSIIILFILFYWNTSPFAATINKLQVDISAILTQLTLKEGLMVDNHIHVSSNLTLVIDKACNGLIPYFFFLSSILAFPSTLSHKIKWAIAAYLIISALNVFRIWLITQLVMRSPNNFSLAHDYLGNLLLVLSALLLFISFIKTR